MTALRVVIADDQGIVRGGLCMILEAADIDVVGEAVDGKAAIESVSRVKPDVVTLRRGRHGQVARRTDPGQA